MLVVYRENNTLSSINTYRSCKETAIVSILTTINQQYDILDERGLGNSDIKQNIIDDLIIFVNSIKSINYEMMLFINANKEYIKGCGIE